MSITLSPFAATILFGAEHGVQMSVLTNPALAAVALSRAPLTSELEAALLSLGEAAQTTGGEGAPQLREEVGHFGVAAVVGDLVSMGFRRHEAAKAISRVPAGDWKKMTAHVQRRWGTARHAMNGFEILRRTRHMLQTLKASTGRPVFASLLDPTAEGPPIGPDPAPLAEERALIQVTPGGGVRIELADKTVIVRRSSSGRVKIQEVVEGNVREVTPAEVTIALGSMDKRIRLMQKVADFVDGVPGRIGRLDPQVSEEVTRAVMNRLATSIKKLRGEVFREGIHLDDAETFNTIMNEMVLREIKLAWKNLNPPLFYAKTLTAEFETEVMQWTLELVAGVTW